LSRDLKKGCAGADNSSVMPTNPADVAHLLRRAGFGATREQIARLSAQSLSQIVDDLVAGKGAPPVAAPATLADPAVEPWKKFVAMQTWWLDRMRTTPAPLVEKMTLFWHGHFATGSDKVHLPMLLWEQNQLFRRHGLGSFRDLTRSVCLHPALLLYLDNEQNVAGSPNENFARELMELFTLGLNQYTQDDVVAAARAWTGHGVNKARTAYEFRPNRHDGGAKTFFGKTKAWDGPEIIDEILTARRDAVSRFIAAKLWGFFAYPGPEAPVLDALAKAFAASNLHIGTLVRAIFLRPEFYSVKAKTGLVRSPTEFVVAAMKASGLGADVAHPEWFVDAMGQRLFEPPDVSGWKSNGAWISSSATMGRSAFARFLTWKANDAKRLVETKGLPPATAVQKVLDAFGITAPSAATRAALERFVVSERAARGWAEQVNLFTLVMLTPEFQLA
jgi:uncharacterized protein (DUF1800 family)